MIGILLTRQWRGPFIVHWSHQPAMACHCQAKPPPGNDKSISLSVCFFNRQWYATTIKPHESPSSSSRPELNPPVSPLLWPFFTKTLMEWRSQSIQEDDFKWFYFSQQIFLDVYARHAWHHRTDTTIRVVIFVRNDDAPVFRKISKGVTTYEQL